MIYKNIIGDERPCIHALFTDSLYRREHSGEAMIGCDWLNAPEERLLQSADDGPCVSTVDYGESPWFYLFHIHEPNGWCCIIHGQIRRSKTPARTGAAQDTGVMNLKNKKQKTKTLIDGLDTGRSLFFSK